MKNRLNKIDPLDITDLFIKVENSFHIRFEENELMHIITFGELCDYIKNKIELAESEDCTTQQAFYKFRKALTELNYGKTITPDTLLFDLLPRHNRISNTRRIEANLGFKLSILRPPYFVMILLIITLFASIIALYYNWQIALFGLALSIGGIWLANRMGKELDLATVGQVAQKMTREHYLRGRRNPKSFNQKEIEVILTDMFTDSFGWDRSELTRDARFV